MPFDTSAPHVERVRASFMAKPEPINPSPLDASPLSSSLIQAVLAVTGSNPSPWLSLIASNAKGDSMPEKESITNDTLGSRDQTNARVPVANNAYRKIAPVDQVAALVSAILPSFGTEAKAGALCILVLACQCKANQEARALVWDSTEVSTVITEACSLLSTIPDNQAIKQCGSSTAAAQFLWFLSRSPPPPDCDVLTTSCWDLASSLVHGLKARDSQTSLACALAISNLSTMSLALRRAVMSRDGPSALLSLIKDTIGEVQEASAAALMSLTAGIHESGNKAICDEQDLFLEEICDNILEAGGAETLVDCARNGDPIVQSTAIGVLQNLSCIHGGGGGREEKICAHGLTLILLVDVIKGLGSEDAIVSALHTLSNLALSKSCHIFFKSTDVLPAILSFCKETKSNHKQMAAAESFYDLVVEVLSNLCRCGDRSLRMQLVHQGAINALKVAVQSPSSEAALSALISLSAEPSIAQSIVETDGLVGCLLQMILSPTCTNGERAIKILANLSLAEPIVKRSLLDAGLANVLSITLTSLARSNATASSLLQLASCRAVMNLGRDSDARKLFASTSIIPSLLRLIARTSSKPSPLTDQANQGPEAALRVQDAALGALKVQDAALGALYHLMSSRSMLAQVVKSGGLKIIAQVVSKPSLNQKKAARILRRVAMHGDEAMRRELVERLGQTLLKPQGGSNPIIMINASSN